MIELLSANPARVINVPGGALSEGAPADITILAPDTQRHDRRGGAEVEVEEHPVRRLGDEGRRRRDHRRRQDLYRAEGV